MKTGQVVVAGAFDDLQARQIRFLEEASKLGELTVLLWSDKLTARFTGTPPKFPEVERRYCLDAIRFVRDIRMVNEQSSSNALPPMDSFQPGAWVMREDEQNTARETFCRSHGLECRVIADSQLAGFPGPPDNTVPKSAGRKKVMVTGCFDWFHSGHVRFCEEAAGLGDLYVIVGSDANVRLLKGEGHPLFSQEQRRYAIGSIRHVKQALISTGRGWLDADPEIQRLKPDVFVVNEDGDKGGKRAYCAKLGMEYVVLRRAPAPGLAARSSTDLRGF